MKTAKQLLIIISLIVLSITGNTQNTFPWPSANNIGIGTVSPAAKLEISGVQDVTGLLLRTAMGADAPHYQSLRFDAYQANGNSEIRSTVDFSATNGSTLNFFTSNNSNGILSERLRIDGNGYIGIATTTPNYPLDVNGKIHSSVTGGNNLILSKSTGSSIAFDNGAGTQSAMIEASSVSNTNHLEFWTNTSSNSGLVERLRIDNNGNVGIGTTDPGTYKLAVNGDMRAKKLTVSQNEWSDYVFDNDYKLRSLRNVETFIKENKHLPDMPSAKEVEQNGINVGDNQALLLKKIEELTLYLIQQDKKIIGLEDKIAKLTLANDNR